MAFKTTHILGLVRAIAISRHSCKANVRRTLSNSQSRRTDGIFGALDEERLRIPWIDALKDAESKRSRRPVPRETVEKTPRRMQDSFHSVILPLAQDKFLSDKYLNAAGHIRLGTVWMDLDALSGIITYKHTGGDVVNVTAALDRIIIENPLNEICDLRYSGQVTHVGTSSMEVTCKVEKAPGSTTQNEDTVLTCTFTLVALDPDTKRPVSVPPLAIETPEEDRLFKQGEARARAAKAFAKMSLSTKPPNEEESELIHRLWREQLSWRERTKEEVKTPRISSMADTVLRTAAIMQPQYRNRHQYQIFGGFLLRATFELAFCCAANFAHARPSFVSADPCRFLNPVPVGSVLYLSATIAYTDPPIVAAGEDLPLGNVRNGKGDTERTHVHVRVDSKVRDVNHDNTKPTGQFHYTFSVPRGVRVMPQSYSEFMIYLDARRRMNQAEGRAKFEGVNTNTESEAQNVLE